MSYKGRTIDVLIMNFSQPDNTGRVGLDFGTPTKIVTGLQKLVQKWLILFLTHKGSVRSDPAFGTNFLKDVALSNANNIEALTNAFNEAAGEVESYLGQQSIADPDERLESAELISLTATEDSIKITLKINSQDPSTDAYITPISVPVKE